MTKDNARNLTSTAAGAGIVTIIGAEANTRAQLFKDWRCSSMTTEQKVKIKKARLARMEHSPKAIKCPGVLRKARREIKNLEAK